MKTKIYVITHEPPQNAVLPENYCYFQVNAKNNPVFCENNDAVGEDNISEKNPYYCELTGAYWIWKNDRESDIVGLMHYRRFLTRNMFSYSQKYYLDAKKIEKLLKKYDYVATKEIVGWQSAKELLFDSVSEHDFNLLRQVISEKFSDYLPAFDKVFDSKKTRLFNICICKKENWDKYYEWLFSVFAELEPLIDMTGYSIQDKRLYGYLSERLMTVYFKKNRCKVKGYRVHIVGTSVSSRIKRKIKKILHLGK